MCSLEYTVHVVTKALKNIYRETAICRNPHNLSNWDSRIIIHWGYKRTLSQNVESTKKKKGFSLYFRQNIPFLNGGLLRNGKVFSTPL